MPATRLQIILIVEAVALAIALVTPVTPSKTGSQFSFAEFLVPDPTYVQQVLAAFVVVNLLIGVIGLVTWIYVRATGGGDGTE